MASDLKGSLPKAMFETPGMFTNSVGAFRNYLLNQMIKLDIVAKRQVEGFGGTEESLIRLSWGAC